MIFHVKLFNKAKVKTFKQQVAIKVTVKNFNSEVPVVIRKLFLIVLYGILAHMQAPVKMHFRCHTINLLYL